MQGNDNDADPPKFEPHYTEIRSADQVQIYESIIGDANGAVTTGLLTAVRYLKDNRLLPRGFDKNTAEPDIAVHGDALDDPDFVGAGDRVRYSVAVGNAPGPFVDRGRTAVSADRAIAGRPICRAYQAPEPQRFTELLRRDGLIVGGYYPGARQKVRSMK